MCLAGTCKISRPIRSPRYLALLIYRRPQKGLLHHDSFLENIVAIDLYIPSDRETRCRLYRFLEAGLPRKIQDPALGPY